MHYWKITYFKAVPFAEGERFLMVMAPTAADALTMFRVQFPSPGYCLLRIDYPNQAQTCAVQPPEINIREKLEEILERSEREKQAAQKEQATVKNPFFQVDALMKSLETEMVNCQYDTLWEHVAPMHQLLGDLRFEILKLHNNAPSRQAMREYLDHLDS